MYQYEILTHNKNCRGRDYNKSHPGLSTVALSIDEGMNLRDSNKPKIKRYVNAFLYMDILIYHPSISAIYICFSF